MSMFQLFDAKHIQRFTPAEKDCQDKKGYKEIIHLARSEMRLLLLFKIVEENISTILNKSFASGISYCFFILLKPKPMKIPAITKTDMIIS